MSFGAGKFFGGWELGRVSVRRRRRANFWRAPPCPSSTSACSKPLIIIISHNSVFLIPLTIVYLLKYFKLTFIFNKLSLNSKIYAEPVG